MYNCLTNHLRVTLSVLLCLGAACSNWNPHICENGRACPPDATCAAAQDICITTNCGNGVLESHEGEVCDDGNISSGDGCSHDCRSTEVCGNGLIDTATGEECDDTVQTVSCNWDCTAATCGDGVINGTTGELCDDMGDSQVCDFNCTPAECGDGHFNQVAEECDSNGDADDCDADCTLPECGDHHTNMAAGEECDDGDTVDGGNGCGERCQLTSGTTCEPTELQNMGFPARDPGLSVRSLAFTISGNNDSQPDVYKIYKFPDKGTHVAFPLMYSYQPLGDKYQSWHITVKEEPDFFSFTVTTSGGGTSNFVSGILYVIGFDSNKSHVSCSAQLSGGGSDNSLSPFSLETRAKVVPFSYMDAYLTEGDEDVGWSISENPDTMLCRTSFDSKLSDNTPDGDIIWHSCLLSLAEGIRVDVWTFKVNEGEEDSHEFLLNTSASHIWLPIVSTYNAHYDPDFGYNVYCATNGTRLSCSARASDADSAPDSYIAGKVIVLQSLYRFEQSTVSEAELQSDTRR